MTTHSDIAVSHSLNNIWVSGASDF